MAKTVTTVLDDVGFPSQIAPAKAAADAEISRMAVQIRRTVMSPSKRNSGSRFSPTGTRRTSASQPERKRRGRAGAPALPSDGMVAPRAARLVGLGPPGGPPRGQCEDRRDRGRERR